MQHRVSSFRLADPTKPGHRKIVAMFLVDPHIPILSTANVPPQRRDWWAAEVRKVDRFAALPEELFQAIIDGVDDFPVSWDEAELIRERLMKERTHIQSIAEEHMYNVSLAAVLLLRVWSLIGINAGAFCLRWRLSRGWVSCCWMGIGFSGIVGLKTVYDFLQARVLM